MLAQAHLPELYSAVSLTPAGKKSKSVTAGDTLLPKKLQVLGLPPTLVPITS